MDSKESSHLTSTPSMSVSERSLPFHFAACCGGLSDPSTPQYKHRRAILELVNKLHGYGLQHHLDIPQIAVVGSQSVGKSSLIESIAGITLPRAQGTCTRAPIECRLSRSISTWSCRVYLRIGGFPDEPFGPPVMDKSEVEERIRRAQLAILNPSRRATYFLGAFGAIDADTENELSFSSNVISVSISGPEIDNLSFVDLPGVIVAVKQGGRENDINEVRDLVTSVIEKQSCLILLVVSGETDIENQGAGQLVKQVDPTGNRTIHVLTKPDRIPRGGESPWIRLLSAKQEHRWFCVKQSDQEQLEAGIDWADARENEHKFFEDIAPWSTLDESTKSRLGTQPLTIALGGKLFDLIRKRLPGLLLDVETKLQGIEGDIASLPQKPAGDPMSTIVSLIYDFGEDVENLVKGRPEAGQDGLIQTFRKSKELFRDTISRQSPEFKLFNKPPQNPIRHPSVSEEVHSILIDEEHASFNSLDNSAVVYLDQVSEYAKSAITRELPHNYPYAVKQHYVTLFMRRWHVPAQTLFENIQGHFSRELRQLVSQHFSVYTSGGLDKLVMRTVSDKLEDRSVVARERMDQCIALEGEEPFTLNEDKLDAYKRKYLKIYTEERRAHLSKTSNFQSYKNGNYDKVVAFMQQMGMPATTKEDLLRLFPIDDSEPEEAIKIMVEVRAYYEVAFRRFIDYIPMIVDFELLKGFSRTLRQALLQSLELGVGDIHARCIAFLKEDPEIVASRRALQRDLERFRAALADLQRISGINSTSAYVADGASAAQHADNAHKPMGDAIPDAENATEYDSFQLHYPPSPRSRPLPRSSSLMGQPVGSEEFLEHSQSPSLSMASEMAPSLGLLSPNHMSPSPDMMHAFGFHPPSPQRSPMPFEVHEMAHPSVIPAPSAAAFNWNQGKKKK